MCFQNLEVRADPPRQFQISFPSEMFKQLLPKDRLRIIREGQKQLDADGRVNLRKLSRDLELNRITVSLWWNRRHELDETGALLPRWAGNSGRPKHKSFRTDADVAKSVDVCENLPIGGHKRDAAAKLGCCEKTLYTHTKKAQMTWRKPPLREAGHTKKVSRKRKSYADACLTPGGRLKKRIRDATWIDHKWVHIYGLNRSHQMQARRSFFSFFCKFLRFL